MKISGLVKSSVIDFPGRIAAVVFTQGCNFRCGFCHNPALLDIAVDGTEDLDEFFLFLEKRKGLLDGVVITGGEPTLQKDLIDFIKQIRSLGYEIKLDSNGSNPLLLKKLLDEKLLDFVAMDIKGPMASYEKIAGFKDTKKIEESVTLLMNSRIDYEFRTTVLPYYHKLEDFHQLGREIKGAKFYTIQGFRPEITYDKSLGAESCFTSSDLQKIKEIMTNYVEKVRILENA